MSRIFEIPLAGESPEQIPSQPFQAFLSDGVDEKAGEKRTLTEAVADFWLARVNDAMYASSGDAVSIASHPGATNGDLGSELDLIAEY